MATANCWVVTKNGIHPLLTAPARSWPRMADPRARSGFSPQRATNPPFAIGTADESRSWAIQA
jgi:hypothetical protein